MIVVHIIRKPLCEPNVATNVLKYQTGGINIGASRIGSDARSYKGTGPNLLKLANHGKGDTGVGLWDGSGSGKVFTVSGRWPPNLILQHLPGCRCTGYQEVQSREDTRPGGDGGRENKTQWRIRPTSATRRGYGRETVPCWDCGPGCPVQDMGQQGGESTSSVRKGGEGEHLDPTTENWRFKRVEGGYTDAGTVTRFFKQVQG